MGKKVETAFGDGSLYRIQISPETETRNPVPDPIFKIKNRNRIRNPVRNQCKKIIRYLKLFLPRSCIHRPLKILDLNDHFDLFLAAENINIINHVMERNL